MVKDQLIKATLIRDHLKDKLIKEVKVTMSEVAFFPDATEHTVTTLLGRLLKVERRLTKDRVGNTHKFRHGVILTDITFKLNDVVRLNKQRRTKEALKILSELLKHKEYITEELVTPPKLKLQPIPSEVFGEVVNVIALLKNTWGSTIEDNEKILACVDTLCKAMRISEEDKDE
jgi:hypothetical protein